MDILITAMAMGILIMGTIAHIIHRWFTSDRAFTGTTDIAITGTIVTIATTKAAAKGCGFSSWLESDFWPARFFSADPHAVNDWESLRLPARILRRAMVLEILFL